MKTILCTLALLSGAAALLAQEPQRAEVEEATVAALSGEWLFVEDRTEGKTTDEKGPPMSVKFTLRVEEDAVVMPRSGGREERIPLDGSVIATPKDNGSTDHRRGEWKDGVLYYDLEVVRDSDQSVAYVLKREFRPTSDGLHVRVISGSPAESVQDAFYRHPEDIALPEPLPATIADLAWLEGAWVGTRGTSSIEERWGPPLGGAMFGVSRTVKADRLRAFEYLRVVERDGGLIYVAQPGGKSPTEFVLVERSATRVAFVNPHHDYPQRIEYELSPEGGLTASIGYAIPGRFQRFAFVRESK